MKKIFLILLAALMLFTSACGAPGGNNAAPDPKPATPEEPEYEALPDEFKPLAERVCGEWYADASGLPVTLTLSGGGTYRLTAADGDTQSGTWKEKDGVLIMDSDEENPVLVFGDSLRMDDKDLIFTREQAAFYVPAQPRKDAEEGSFDGYWKSHFAAAGRGTVLSEAVGDDTEIYIEGTKAATNGTLLGLAQYDCVIENGIMTFMSDKGAVKLEILQDGFLRLALEGDTPAVLFLTMMPLPGEVPEPVGP